MPWFTTFVINKMRGWPLIGLKIRLMMWQSSSSRLCVIGCRPLEGLINLQNHFDNTGKILVSQQSKEIRLELLSWDMKLLSHIQSDNIWRPWGDWRIFQQKLILQCNEALRTYRSPQVFCHHNVKFFVLMTQLRRLVHFREL